MTPDEQRFKRVLAALLQIGVFASAAVVVAGGALYLVHHASEPSEQKYSQFQDEPKELRSPGGIVAATLEFRDRAIIQLGLLVLIATPVARVLFSVVGYARQRDFTYVALTLIVLAVLLYGLFIEGP
jgi:uncharacterized membrane protein